MGFTCIFISYLIDAIICHIHMNIHEYQAKELFAKHGISIPKGYMVTEVEDTADKSSSLGGFPVVVKAQIHAGGRGKGGGVKLAQSASEAQDLARKMMGMVLVTHQTGPEGKVVNKLLIEQGLNIKDELYLSIVADRSTADIIIIASTEGGMDIEHVAAHSPEKIKKVHLNPLLGLQPYHCRKAAFGLGLAAELVRPFSVLLSQLFQVFTTYDCTQLEINPLVVTTDGVFVALDAKINFDDSALYRHKDIQELADPSEDDPLEVKAAQFGLNYIKLDGNVGNMVNGAGLAMATMDIIKMAGAEPANFLDVGGGASADMVKNGFRIILEDKNVKGILVNIFGGILRCDVLAEGIVMAAKETEINVPVVVRMEGTNVETGRQILADSGLNIITAIDLQDAAKKVSDIVAGGVL